MNILPHAFSSSGKQFPAQVRRLLSLFSLKRLKDQAPHRRLTRNKVARPSGYSTSKDRRLVNKSPTSNQVPGECEVHNNHGLVISNMHQGYSFYNDDKATDDGRFETYTDVGYEHRTSAFLNECFRDLIRKVGGNIDAGEYASKYVKFTYKIAFVILTS